jgi:chromosome segregation ATPase
LNKNFLVVILQEDLRETNARLEATQAKKEAIGQELEITKQQLAEEVAAHGTTHEQLATTRIQLQALQHEYLVVQDELEAERELSNKLQKQVDNLQQRLESLQKLRQQQNEVALAQRVQWEQQLQQGREEQEGVKAVLAELQQKYFDACELLY